MDREPAAKARPATVGARRGLAASRDRNRAGAADAHGPLPTDAAGGGVGVTAAAGRPLNLHPSLRATREAPVRWVAVRGVRVPRDVPVDVRIDVCFGGGSRTVAEPASRH